ncbi:hypothetical protein, unlikely [Trypanosoma brucei gambiense DAL972]|uniref:Uncharacterized protein n=1 Tax=Trypanosoma brucei gambiense (strain MHOM/CI/86/DAL972) TaxID=679716 RepID=D0A3C5_TRYB9|nr:hypothetical protein, unlikely [Trypanosoma brucei gambiense DAL972]CBH15769.1 hypothetical protein, unlikely [Trypanosoma brucei gambiense DAL972]|eukprot:XP_011778033.1 hypothetical protein, unlikely [Trypanosoma brucei gambiense DAL972]
MNGRSALISLGGTKQAKKKIHDNHKKRACNQKKTTTNEIGKGTTGTKCITPPFLPQLLHLINSKCAPHIPKADAHLHIFFLPLSFFYTPTKKMIAARRWCQSALYLFFFGGGVGVCL